MRIRRYYNKKKNLFVLLIFCILFSYTHAQDSLHIRKLPLEPMLSPGKQEVLIIYLTGDGGWNNFSQSLSNSFVQRGYSLVALNSRKYFWEAKTPEKFAEDISLIAAHFLKIWNKKAVLIVGYSFGADVAAFLPSRLREPALAKTKLIVLLSAAASTDFVVKWSDLLGGSDSRDRRYDVAAELGKSQLPILCLFGAEEDLILRKELRSGKKLTVEEMPGAHHYNLESAMVVDRILAKI
jgi:type IV secretory pathway VirJ component